METLLENLKTLRDSADTDGQDRYAELAQLLLNLVSEIDDVANLFNKNPNVPKFVVDFLDDIIDTVEETVS